MAVMEIVVEAVGESAQAPLDEWKRCVDLVERSTLRYKAGEGWAVVQGSIPELFALAERIHTEARDGISVEGVKTTIRITDAAQVLTSVESLRPVADRLRTA